MAASVMGFTPSYSGEQTLYIPGGIHLTLVRSVPLIDWHFRVYDGRRFKPDVLHTRSLHLLSQPQSALTIAFVAQEGEHSEWYFYDTDDKRCWICHPNLANHDLDREYQL